MKRYSFYFVCLIVLSSALACTGKGKQPSKPVPHPIPAQKTQPAPKKYSTIQPSLPVQNSWASALSINQVNAQTIGQTTTASSTQLQAFWHPPADSIDHYLIEVSEDGYANTFTLTSPGDAVSETISGLKAATSYQFHLQACLNADCSQSITSENSATGATDAEYWQIQGTSNSYQTATKVVEGGNNMAYVIVWGNEAGPTLSGYAQLYYHPFPLPDGGYAIRTAITAQPGNDLQTLSLFTSTEGGLLSTCNLQPNSEDCPDGTIFIATFQAVPLLEKHTVRLFFEAANNDPAQSVNLSTRLYSVESTDGYQGQDFNLDPASTDCGGIGSTDYQPDGNCPLHLEIGLDTDSTGGGSGLIQVRQSKIGYPKRDSWLWGETPGTFIVITGTDSCQQTKDGLFYALWDGSSWQVVKDDQGCARPLVLKAHGPVVVHLGNGQYKLYYEDSSNGPKDKPFRMIYANAAQTGDATTVDFEDWENAATMAHEVHFLWPDGSLLDAADESGLGDHMVLVPGDDLNFQIMYLNLGGLDNSKNPTAAQGIGVAVLLNP